MLNNSPSEYKISAILLLGGSGQRLGSELPKQFHLLSGKPIYLHTIDACISLRIFKEIVLVCPEEWVSHVQETLLKEGYPPCFAVVSGGSTRQESSYFGLLACSPKTDFVVIHDAVRPFVSERILLENISNVISAGAVDTCIASADTIIHTEEGDFIDSIPKRKEFKRGQTPQSFSYPLILQAHQKAMEDGLQDCSDDCQLALRLGHPIRIVEGEENNIKITTELDLFIAEQIMRLPGIMPRKKNGSQASLQGKIFAVTGGTGGIGKALCTLLAKEGATALPLSTSSTTFSADLSDSRQAQNAFADIYKHFGPIDGLINSIGSLQVKEFLSLTPEEIEHILSCNLKSVIYSCRYVQIKDRGHIVNIASSSYSKGRKGYMMYSAAKAALVNFTQGLSEELTNLHINVVVPQRTHTTMRTKNFPSENPNTLLSPEYVAEQIVELLKQTGLTGSIMEIRKQQTSFER